MNVFQIFIILCVGLIAGQLGLWVAERTPPTIQVEARIEPDIHHPGSRLLIRETLDRHKVCSVRVEKILFDANGVRYPLSEEYYVAAPGPVGIDKFAEPVRIPKSVAEGEGYIRIIKVYYCNPLHSIWPVAAPLIQIPFKVEGPPVEERDSENEGSIGPRSE